MKDIGSFGKEPLQMNLKHQPRLRLKIHAFFHVDLH